MADQHYPTGPGAPPPSVVPSAEPPEIAERPADPAWNLDAFGQTGLHRYGGYVYEETHPRLSGAKAVLVYREMSDNDATIGSALNVIESLARNVEWRFEPKDESPEAKAAQEFVESCIEDMAHTWEEFLSEVLSMLPFGFAPFELVYKQRRGPNEKDPKFRSRFTDGKIGWRKIAIRAQDTLLRWEFFDDGALRGMWQLAPPSYRIIYVPADKLVLFRPKAPRDNPEGRSILRNAYRSWYLLKRLQEIEAIGIERDLAGMPVIQLPPEYLMSTATDVQKAFVRDMKTLVQQVKRDEREGLTIPAKEISVPDGKGGFVLMKTGFDFTLMGTGGRRAIDIGATIRRYQQDIAMTMLCEFLFLGMDATGSFALADSKAELFASALGATLDTIASTFNLKCIAPLMELNGYPREVWPTLVHGDIRPPDLGKIGAFLQQATAAGVLLPDDGIERKVREIANLPEKQEPLIQRQAPAPAAPDQAADQRTQIDTQNTPSVSELPQPGAQTPPIDSP